MEYGYETARPLYPGARPDRGGSGGNNSPSYYPRIAQPAGSSSLNRAPPLRPPPTPVSNPSPSSSGTGIKVVIKPAYRVAPPAQLLIQSREVPRTLFQFDFDLERRILAEAELQGHSHGMASALQSSQSNGGTSFVEGEDATVSKYVAMGHNKQAVIVALQTFGDIQNKVIKFCPAYTRIREMGFPSDAVAAALAQNDNDEERAIAHLV